MNDGLKSVLEALIFISQDPLTEEQARVIFAESPTEEIRAAFEALVREYESGDHGIRIIRTGGGYVFTTHPAHDAWVRRFLQIDRKNKLSSAGLETLAAVAYHQPVTQAEISAIRGVDSSYTLKSLLEKKLLKIVGRKKAPGNPLIYRTSERFLQYFGLNSLDELPSEEEIGKLLDEAKAEGAEG
jgi:segregation and condensation protein B